MSIRILGGSAKGIDLALPPNSITRPTSVMLKRKLFDAYQNLEHCTFIDLCAGSGSVGLEAVSRGADEVVLVENSAKVIKFLKTNIDKVKSKLPNSKMSFVKDDFKKWLPEALKNKNYNHENCFIFFDPPYEKVELYEYIFNLLKESEFQGLLVFEACQQKSFTLEACTQKFTTPRKVYKQGTSFFALFDFDPV